MTPAAWVREQLALKRALPAISEETATRHVELRADAEAKCGADAGDALHLLRLVRNGVMAASELEPEEDV